ncbi:MAG TPA: DUF4743 domain-containing protein [Casimicrobiaceae bacterium]|nr:DUF4743 domain-containing protein [Casimicrobiaceae bacterium]
MRCAILNRLAARLGEALAPPSITLRPWIVDGLVVGYLDDRRANMLATFSDMFVVNEHGVFMVPSLIDVASRTAALDRIARELSRRGELTRWRDEHFAVRARANDAPLLFVERAAARFFGIATEAAHLNGAAHNETRMWIARRSAGKSIDPGQLDNLVGGGVGATLDIQQTIVKEAREEAGIDESLAQSARRATRVEIARMQSDGLQRETIHVFDLVLPDDFVPINHDGEVSQFRCVSIEEAAELAGNAHAPDLMTADAALVVADWLMRHGHVPRDSRAFDELDVLRRASID